MSNVISLVGNSQVMFDHKVPKPILTRQQVIFNSRGQQLFRLMIRDLKWSIRVPRVSPILTFTVVRLMTQLSPFVTGKSHHHLAVVVLFFVYYSI